MLIPTAATKSQNVKIFWRKLIYIFCVAANFIIQTFSSFVAFFLVRHTQKHWEREDTHNSVLCFEFLSLSLRRCCSFTFPLLLVCRRIHFNSNTIRSILLNIIIVVVPHKIIVVRIPSSSAVVYTFSTVPEIENERVECVDVVVMVIVCIRIQIWKCLALLAAICDKRHTTGRHRFCLFSLSLSISSVASHHSRNSNNFAEIVFLSVCCCWCCRCFVSVFLHSLYIVSSVLYIIIIIFIIGVVSRVASSRVESNQVELSRRLFCSHSQNMIIIAVRHTTVSR